MRAMVLSLCFAATAGVAHAQQMARVFYPATAQEQGIGGRVVLECPVGDDGRLACVVTEETPEGMAFGAAALRMSEDWRISSRTRDGQPTAGGRIRRTLVFKPGPPPRVVTDPSSIDGIRWAEQPDARDFARLYPREALRRGLSGRATLDCVVNESYRLDCEVENEDPPGVGFGAATLRIAEEFRIATHRDSGESTIGAHIRRTIRWVMQ